MKPQFFLFLSIILLFSLPAYAEQSCSEEDKYALNECIATCNSTHPECSSSVITADNVLEYLTARCGECENARNFGRFNSCLVRFRNGLRMTGLLTPQVRDALKDLRTACRQHFNR